MTPEEQSAHNDALVRAFVQGAKWWDYYQAGSTMRASDQDQAEGQAAVMLKLGKLGSKLP